MSVDKKLVVEVMRKLEKNIPVDNETIYEILKFCKEYTFCEIIQCYKCNSFFYDLEEITYEDEYGDIIYECPHCHRNCFYELDTYYNAFSELEELYIEMLKEKEKQK